jgi:hypothetical protein
MPTHDTAELELAFGEVLDDTLALLERLSIEHMLIGGLAVAVRAEPRATKDIDLLVRVDPTEARALVAEMSRGGFRAIVHGAPGPGAVIRFVRTGDDGVDRWVDVLCAGTPFEDQALERAPREQLFGRALPVATVEDLIVFKLLASRPQDLADVDVLLRYHAGQLDDDYIDARAGEWEIEALLARARQTARGG